MLTHFTAWLTTTRPELEGDDCDVIVLADDVISYTVDDEGNEDQPVWSSTGNPLFHALTGISTEDAAVSKAERRAEGLLAEAGWRTVGNWDAVDTGGVITVERADTAETWTLAQVAEYLGASSTKYADTLLRRLGVTAVGRQPGRGGQNLYPAAEVMYAHATRPGQGTRTDLKDPK